MLPNQGSKDHNETGTLQQTGKSDPLGGKHDGGRCLDLDQRQRLSVIDKYVVTELKTTLSPPQQRKQRELQGHTNQRKKKGVSNPGPPVRETGKKRNERKDTRDGGFSG